MSGPDERGGDGRDGDGRDSDATGDDRLPDEPPTVREATPADRVRLLAVQSAALAEPWPELLEAGLDGPPLVLVAEADRPVGYALVVTHGTVAYLAELAVAPGEQGRGYGSALLAALLDRLRTRGLERVRLTARADDDRVRAFYRSFDFAVVGRVPDHYDSGDGVVMARDL